MNKYELTNETVQHGSRTLYRIRALRDLPGGVKTGDMGGFVESVGNLSQDGAAWVFGDARVFGAAWVSGAAQVLHVTGLPSGVATLYPTEDGWELNIGCWSGTVDSLEELIAGDDWPESRGEERERRRPGLEALVALCRAHVAAVAQREKATEVPGGAALGATEAEALS